MTALGGNEFSTCIDIFAVHDSTVILFELVGLGSIILTLQLYNVHVVDSKLFHCRS